MLFWGFTLSSAAMSPSTSLTRAMGCPLSGMDTPPHVGRTDPGR